MNNRRREWFPGAIYHVMQRGTQQRAIFRDDDDKLKFFFILKKTAELTGCKVHAFCLMTNHYHILLETGNTDIGIVIGVVAQRYSIYHNKKYGFKGHLYDDRYNAILVREDAYFLATSRYIHLNPVKAGIVEAPEDYAWSSFRSMCSDGYDGLTYRDRTWAYFGENAVLKYRAFVYAGREQPQEDELAIGKALGDEEYWTDEIAEDDVAQSE